MKKILILGASILQLPAIRRAKELGYYVGVIDYNPQAVGVSEADEFFNVSTNDIDGVVQVAEQFKPNGIMTLATDMPMRAVAKACEVCGLPGISYDTAVKATDKGEMIKAFESYGVEHPWYYVLSSKPELYTVIDKLSYPCIIKPTDNAGSRGVTLCDNLEDLLVKYDYAQHESRGGSVIIEEYLQGPEFSVEVIVVDGEPHILQITEKFTTGAPHFVEMGHKQPARLSEKNKERIRNLAVKACNAVGINVGPAHVEMILTKDGPIMVELGARMGGDCITTHLVPLSTGIDMVGSTIKIACGEVVDIEPVFYKGSAILFFDSHKGVIKRIEGIEDAQKIPGIREISTMYDVGEIIGDISSSTDRVGFVIAQAETAEEAVKTCEEAKSMVKITVEEL